MTVNRPLGAQFEISIDGTPRTPGKAITLRHSAHLIEDSRRSRLAVLPWSDRPRHRP
jgi:hypothetical protein